jgi:hypothetical protein
VNAKFTLLGTNLRLSGTSWLSELSNLSNGDIFVLFLLLAAMHRQYHFLLPCFKFFDTRFVTEICTGVIPRGHHIGTACGRQFVEILCEVV